MHCLGSGSVGPLHFGFPDPDLKKYAGHNTIQNLLKKTFLLSKHLSKPFTNELHNLRMFWHKLSGKKRKNVNIFYLLKNKIFKEMLITWIWIYFFISNTRFFIQIRYPDGSMQISFPDGSVKKISRDGCEDIHFPDGTRVEVGVSGDRVLHLPNGQREEHSKDMKKRVYPDGTLKILYTDGRQETRYSNGRIRIKDGLGKLIKDSHS